MKKLFYLLILSFLLALPMTALCNSSLPPEAQQYPVWINYTNPETRDFGWDGNYEIGPENATATVLRDYVQTHLLGLHNIEFNGNGHTVKMVGPEDTYPNPIFEIRQNTTSKINDLTAYRARVSPCYFISVKGTLYLNNTVLIDSEYESNSTLSIGDTTYNNACVTIDGDSQIFGNSRNIAVINIVGGTLNILNGMISSPIATIRNTGSTLNMSGGEVFCSSSNYAIADGTITITGGTVSCTNGSAIKIRYAGDKLSIANAAIKNSKIGIDVIYPAPVTIGSGVVFNNNKTDIFLAKDALFTVESSFTGNATIDVADYPAVGQKRQLTSKDTDSEMLSHFTSVNPDYAVRYDSEEQYLYLDKRIHAWAYTANDNVITAKCTAETDCPYSQNPLTLTLNAEDSVYTGSAYAASVSDGITAITGAAKQPIAYFKTDLEGATADGEPVAEATEPGHYYASIMLQHNDYQPIAVKAFTIRAPEPVLPDTGDHASYGLYFTLLAISSALLYRGSARRKASCKKA